ncbi:hypothetical protein PTSG_04065 [Salpingoeca rosetta]|uniref:Phytanoyl-CoA dioxygenase n=1 Tax=Salpingoeca rosetta (strain ATCC 50818 / BSB-021) TaxID=946362 RepID=F2U7P1_SALR5|nr:uncharacterized protein PTSG_04065 [Salpingoeca rosetta]EGD83458.1 hypothetical protein PTSG_04065 [Salpingoeca rosetta]|eukprot:XP_004994962.1 hypothetical protein PTSG_04065 [Salpingoeca rosetta]
MTTTMKLFQAGVVLLAVAVTVGGGWWDSGVAAAADEYCEADSNHGTAGTCHTARTSDSEDPGAVHEEQPPESHWTDAFASYPHTDIYEDWNKKGIREAQAGNFDLALEYFRAASHHSPFRGDIWSNIGHAILDATKASATPIHHDVHLPIMREARAAFELATLLGNEPAKRFLGSIKEDLQSWHPTRHLGDNAKVKRRASAEMSAIEHMQNGEHVDAANALCKNKDDIYVSLHHDDMAGPLTAATARRIFLLLRICGVVALREVMQPAVLDRIYNAYKDDFARFQSDLQRRSDSTNGEWTDAAERSTDRYEVKFPLRYPYTDDAFTANRVIIAAAKLVMNNKIEIDTFSTVTSLPNAPVQPWHGDVGPLFHWQAAQYPLPPQGVVVVLPLGIPVNATNGPTEFMTGSHIPMGPDFWRKRLHDPITPVHRLDTDVGSAVLFDIRVFHRGTGNPSPHPRPIVYMSLVYDWYSDTVNFKVRQTRAFDEYTGSKQKLMARLDTHDYIRQLEELLAEKGVDISSLTSRGGYKQVELKA